MLTFKQFLLESMVPGISPGVANEQMLIDQLRTLLDENKPSTLIFQSANQSKTFRDVVDVQDTSKDTRNMQKADVVLIDSKGLSYPISLKNDKADMWASVDTLMGAKTRKLIDKLVDAKKIELNHNKATDHYSLSTSFAKKLNPAETALVMFGSDILPDGCVVCRTFEPEDFVKVENKITIQCTSVFTSIADVENTSYEPWLLVRSEGGRNVLPLGYKGIRPLAVYKRRSDAKSVLKV